MAQAHGGGFIGLGAGGFWGGMGETPDSRCDSSVQPRPLPPQSDSFELGSHWGLI